MRFVIYAAMVAAVVLMVAAFVYGVTSEKFADVFDAMFGEALGAVAFVVLGQALTLLDRSD